MSRIITLTGLVGTKPEARHGQNTDYVKFRLGTCEPGEPSTWWYNVFCYGKNAKLALEKIDVGDNLLISAELLPPRDNNKSPYEPAIAMLNFKWLPREQRQEQQSTTTESETAFDFDSFDDIPEIPFTSTRK